MPIQPRQVIAIAGAERAGPMVAEMARDVGKNVIAKGFHLLCGGTGALVSAACEGAQEEKANLKRRGKFLGDAPVVMGLLAGSNKSDGNAELDIALPTGLGVAIHTVVCASADALIALEGGAATLSHVALAWQLGKPIVLIAPDGSVLESLVGERIDSNRADMIMTADSAERAVEMIAERLAANAPPPKSGAARKH